MKELLNFGFPSIERPNLKIELTNIARLYAEVFAGPPWNEYTQCKSCSEFFGLQTSPGNDCLNCGGELSLAYPEEETKDYIAKEASKPDSSIFVAKEGGEIVGFVWGYTYDNPLKFAEQKYRTPEMQAIIKRLLEANGICSSFFYFSECGIKESRRGKGISNILADNLIRETNLPILLRTNWQSPMTAVAERLGMTQIMGPSVKIDRINSLILPVGDFINRCYDLEIEERVLFLLK